MMVEAGAVKSPPKRLPATAGTPATTTAQFRAANSDAQETDASRTYWPREDHMMPLTDVAWQRLVLTIGRLADKLGEEGRADLAYLLDVIETLAES